MIVVDVGAARYGGDYSVERLIEEFHPEYLYAIDPNLSEDPAERLDPDFDIGETAIIWMKAAAWTYDGWIGFVSAGLSSWLTYAPGRPQAECVDLARFIRTLPPDEVVLKVDAEKSEYDLLEHLIATRTDELLKLAWVEWHCITCGRGGGHAQGCRKRTQSAARRKRIEEQMSCEMAEWNW